MIARVSTVLILCGLASTAVANEMKSAAEAALDRAQVFTDFSHSTAEEILAPEVNTSLPQSSMDVPALEEAGMLKAADDTSVEGTTYNVIGQHQHDSTFAPSSDSLEFADGVELDPLAIVESGTFEASGGQCTVTTFEDAPEFTRSCDAVRLARTETCTQVPSVTFRYRVHTYCVGANRDTECFQFDWPGTGSCRGGYDTFYAGVEPGVQYDLYCESSVDPRDHRLPNFLRAALSVLHSIEWINDCSGDVDPAICVQGQQVCTGEPISWTSDPVTVTEPCSELTTQFMCPSDQYQSDCQIFEENPSCELVDASCYSTDVDGVCGAFEYTYTCGSGSTQTGVDAQCENINVCVAGVCDSVEQEPNDEIPQALAGIGLLNSMAADWNSQDLFDDGCVPGDADAGLDPSCFGMSDLNYFASEVIGCRKAVLAIFNCCRDSGWALGVFTSCKDKEYRLLAAMEAKRTKYLRTRCSEKVFFICVEKTREHCVFNGRFAREVSYQGQRQLYGSFECRGLTHEEFAQIDFSEIDMSPLFADLVANVEDLDVGVLEERIRSNALLNAPQVRTENE